MTLATSFYYNALWKPPRHLMLRNQIIVTKSNTFITSSRQHLTLVIRFSISPQADTNLSWYYHWIQCFWTYKWSVAFIAKFDSQNRCKIQMKLTEIIPKFRALLGFSREENIIIIRITIHEDPNTSGEMWEPRKPERWLHKRTIPDGNSCIFQKRFRPLNENFTIKDIF